MGASWYVPEATTVWTAEAGSSPSACLCSMFIWRSTGQLPIASNGSAYCGSW